MTQSDSPPPATGSPRAWSLIAWSFRLVVYGGVAAAFVYGGPVLRVAAGLGLGLSLWADFEGAARHALRLGMTTLAIIALPFMTPAMAGVIAAEFGGSAMNPLNLGLGFMTSILILALVGAMVGWLGRRFSRWISSIAPLAQTNRGIGSMLGACEGALVVAGAIWVMGLVEAPLSAFAKAGDSRPMVIDTLLAVRDAIEADPAGRYIQQLNPLPEIPTLGAIQDMAEVAADPEAMREFFAGPAMKAVLESPAFQRHINRFRDDPRLRAAVERRDLAAITSSPAFAELMSDQDVFDTLSEHWGALRAELADRPPDPFRR